MISKENSRDAGSELVTTNDNVCAPGPYDVVCGRGKISRDHVGNLRFRSIVDAHKKRYRNAETKDDKTRVSLSVVDVVRNSCDPPGRFLRLDEETGTWYDVGEKGARERVSLALRTMKDVEPLKAPKPVKKRKREEKVAPSVDVEKMAALLAKQKEIFKLLIEVAEADEIDSHSDSSTDDNEQQYKKRRCSEDKELSCP